MSVGQWRMAIGKAIIPVERRWLKNTATKIEAPGSLRAYRRL